MLNTPQTGALVTGSQTAVVATPASPVVFPSVCPTHLLLTKMCEEAGGKQRAPMTFLVPEGATEPYFIMSLGSQSSAALEAEFTSRKERQQSSLTYYCPATCGVLSPASF